MQWKVLHQGSFAMAYRKRRQRRTTAATWKIAKRCVFFFTTVCIIPVLLVLLVTTDQYLRPLQRNRLFLRSNMDQYSDEVMISKMSNATIVEKRFKERKNYLKMACINTGLDLPRNDSLHKPNPWEFLINKNYHLVWCNVFKAASTSWMYNFNLLAGYSPTFLRKTRVVPLSLARRKYPRPSLEMLNSAFDNSVSFIIVRHPFERLLSAYRDKFQFSLPNTYHRKLGNAIIATYRQSQNKDSLPSQRKCPTFPEFVMFVIDSVKYGQPLDMHWTPITEFCTPCMFQLDFIAHTETLQEDQEYIIYKAKLEHIIKPEWKNHGRSTLTHIKTYYSKLTRTQVLQLYNIYRYDFILFNYSIDGYMEMAKEDLQQQSASTIVDDYDDSEFPKWLFGRHSSSDVVNRFNGKETNRTL